MSYVDGFVIPIAADKVEDYRAIAAVAETIWRKHGALDYKECVVDDDGHDGVRSFADLAGAGEGEVTVFAFITYRSREHRDEVNAKVFADPAMNMDPGGMPFDVSRMACGGFRTIVGG